MPIRTGADLQHVADQLALRELYARYCFGLDYHDNDQMLDCFTTDGVFSLSDRGDFRGHDQIQAILDASAPTRHRHNILNVVVDEIDGDTATMRAYFILIHPTDGRITSWGHYQDDAVRCEDGIWRWTMKRVHFDWRADDYAARSEGQTTDKLLTS